MMSSGARSRNLKGLMFVQPDVNSVIVRIVLIAEFFTILFAGPSFGLARDSTLTRKLLEAVTEGDVKQIEQLLINADESKTPYNATELLASAAWKGRTDIMKLLLKRGAQINPKGRFIDPPLISAVRGKGVIAAVKVLLDSGANIEIQDSCDGNTPLIQAAQMGRTEIAKLLLSYSARMDAKNYRGSTALTLAAWWGKKDVVKLLLEKGALKHGTASMGERALANAAFRNHLEIVKLLRDKGVQLNFLASICLGNVEETRRHLKKGIDRSIKSKKAYKQAARKAFERGHVEVIKLLAEAGIDTKQRHPMRRDQLFDAVRKGQTEVVAQLLKMDADVNYLHRLGYTALSVAAEKGYVDIVQLLLEHGANPNIAKETYKTPINMAASNGHINIVKLLLKHGADPRGWNGSIHYKLIKPGEPTKAILFKSLIQAGLSYRPNSPEGWVEVLRDIRDGYSGWRQILKNQGVKLTPKLSALLGDFDGVKRYIRNNQGKALEMSYLTDLLALAAMHGHLIIVKLLLDNGADVNYEDQVVYNPLVEASLRGHADIVQLLLDHGATTNKELWDSPLFVSVGEGHLGAVKVLLQQGKGFKADKKELTQALVRAAENNHIDVVKELLKNGAKMDFWSAISIGDTEVVKRFIADGAYVNEIRESEGEFNETPLIRAAIHDRPEVIEILVDNGVDIESKDVNFGFSALCHAAYRGYTKSMKALLDRGADISGKNNYGDSAIKCAAKAGRVEAVNMLLEYGANLHTGQNGSNEALRAAVTRDKPEVVKVLLQHDDKNKSIDPTVHESLNYATKKGLREIRKLLQVHIDRFASKN